MGHPGTPNLYDMSKPVGGRRPDLPRPVRRGARRREPAGRGRLFGRVRRSSDGYPEFTMQMLMDLGWDGDLTDAERAAIDAVAGSEDQLEDRPFGRHPAGRDQAWLRAVRQRQGARPWCGTFPDPIPLHREPLYTPRRDLVADYPTYEDRKFYRLPTMYASIQKQDFSKDYPMILTSGRLVEYEGGGEEIAVEQVARRTPAGHVRGDPPEATPTISACATARRSGSRAPEGAKVKVMAMVTERVGVGVAFMPFHFGGHFEGADLRRQISRPAPTPSCWARAPTRRRPTAMTRSRRCRRPRPLSARSTRPEGGEGRWQELSFSATPNVASNATPASPRARTSTRCRGGSIGAGL